MSAYAPAAPNAYRESAVLTATPEQLVVMLYDGANRFLTQSAVAMREGRAGLAGEKLRRAEAIIDELLATLDMSVGEIAERLQALYLFFKDHLMAARLHQDAAKVEEVARLMRELRGAWAGIAGADSTAGPPTTTP
jgi:flagellar protein FliS